MALPSWLVVSIRTYCNNAIIWMFIRIFLHGHGTKIKLLVLKSKHGFHVPFFSMLAAHDVSYNAYTAQWTTPQLTKINQPESRGSLQLRCGVVFTPRAGAPRRIFQLSFSFLDTYACLRGKMQTVMVASCKSHLRWLYEMDHGISPLKFQIPFYYPIVWSHCGVHYQRMLLPMAKCWIPRLRTNKRG